MFILCLEISNFVYFTIFIPEEGLNLLMVLLIHLYIYETDPHYAYHTGK
jgi:hypothetical protein